MALSIFSVLRQHGTITEETLAQSFLDHYDLTRGYGPAISRFLHHTKSPSALLEAARALFDGQGSYGNGSAMRIAPLGAYFADDLEQVIDQTRRSSIVTHTHPEAVAGAVAVAVAAAQAWRLRSSPPPGCHAFLESILPYVPESEVKARLRRALSFSPDTSIYHIAAMLGNGSQISAQDTVPFTLWCAGQHLDHYEAALWLTAKGLGDVDTTCAIVGGIVATYTGLEGIPPMWRAYREQLPEWPFQEETRG